MIETNLQCFHNIAAIQNIFVLIFFLQDIDFLKNLESFEL